MIIVWKQLQAEGHNPREASDRLYQYLNRLKRPPTALESTVNELLTLSDSLNSKCTSKAALYARLRKAELDAREL